MNFINTGLRLSSLVVAAVIGLSSCSTEQPAKAPATETIRNIPVLAVQPASVPDLLEAVGTVHAARTSDLASQMMGNIVEVRAHEGDHVQRGQVLAAIDDSQPRAAVDRATAASVAAQQQLAAADSDLALAESTLKRYQSLYEREIGQPAGVRRGESPSAVCSRASRHGASGRGPGAGSSEPGPYVSRLHANSRAVRRRGYREEGRRRYVGFTRRADLRR